MNVHESIRNYVRRSSDELPGDNNDILLNAVTDRRALRLVEECRILFSFWLLGLCNNIYYEIVLTELRASIRRNLERYPIIVDTIRPCLSVDFAATALIALVPPVISKVFVPFIPLMIHVRVVIIVLFNLMMLLMLYNVPTFDKNEWIITCCVLVITFFAGFGESSFLAYTAFYSTQQNISTWSSGANIATLVGKAEAVDAWGRKGSQNKLYTLSLFKYPIIMTIAFWLILPHPFISKAKYHLNDLDIIGSINQIPRMEDVHTVTAKMIIFFQYFNSFTRPFGLVSLFTEIMIVGLFPVLDFPNDIIALKDQPFYYNLAFSIGRGVGASTVNIMPINKLWLLAFLQCLNMCLLWMEVFWGYLVYTLICLACVFWAGLIHGASYVNTFRRIINEVEPLQREFTLAINSCADSAMIILAGVAGNVVLQFLCEVPSPYEI